MVRSEAARPAEDAKRSKLSYLGFLAELLEAEVDAQAERRRQRRMGEGRFPRLKRLADFDLDAAPTINPATLAILAAGGYITTGDPVVLLGDSGTGKSHLLIGLGLAACEQGLRVRYITCAQLVNELAEAADERRPSRLIGRYGRLDLLCLDELGYVKLDTRGSELLFQILTEREEKSSVAVASNLPFRCGDDAVDDGGGGTRRSPGWLMIGVGLADSLPWPRQGPRQRPLEEVVQLVDTDPAPHDITDLDTHTVCPTCHSVVEVAALQNRPELDWQLYEQVF